VHRINWIIAGLLCAVPGVAQISNLVTTDDGGVLLFESNIRLSGTALGPQSKILRWDGAFSLVFAPRAFPSDIAYDYATGPAISGDGTVYGYAVGSGCFKIGCIPGPIATYVRNGQTTGAGGEARLSHNGRYALTRDPIRSGPAVYRLDFETGERVPLTDESSRNAVLGITDSGLVLIRTPVGLYLGKPNETSVIQAQSDAILDAAVSADGSRVLYSVRIGASIELRDGDRVLASIVPLATDSFPGFGIVISNDGARALILESAGNSMNASWIDFGTRIRSSLGPLRTGSRVATLSGDGRVVWMVEPDGHLARLSLDTGERLRIGDALPEIRSSSINVRGSLERLRGPFAAPAADDWSLSITNSEGELLPIPILEATADHLDYQLPWTLPLRFSYFWPALTRSGNSFEQVLPSVQVNEAIPNFWIDPAAPRVNGDPILTAAHEEYRSLVTTDHPGRPGELLHVYLTGLGPVTPPQPDFTAAPKDTEVRTTAPVTCSFNTLGSGGPRVPAVVRFSGLAPGMVGIYLLEIVVPDDWTPPVSFGCLTGSFGGGGYLPVAK